MEIKPSSELIAEVNNSSVEQLAQTILFLRVTESDLNARIRELEGEVDAYIKMLLRGPDEGKAAATIMLQTKNKKIQSLQAVNAELRGKYANLEGHIDNDTESRKNLLTRLQAAIELIQKHQWSAKVPRCQSDGYGPIELKLACPECLRTEEEGHTPDCKIEAILKEG